MLLKGNPPALSLASCKLKRCKAAQTRWHRTFPGSTFSRPSLVSISAEASLAKASRPVRCAATAAEEPSLQAELAALEAEQNEAVAKGNSFKQMNTTERLSARSYLSTSSPQPRDASRV